MSSNLALSQMPRKTRVVRAGNLLIGGGNRISVQSMCATRTQDIDATLNQINLLKKHEADLIRIAIDSKKDVEALRSIRAQTDANLVVDLQESYQLVEKIAPFVQKIRYNPGHLHHHEKSKSIADKVKILVDAAGANGCAIRIGVNFGSLDPNLKNDTGKSTRTAIDSATQHIELMDKLGFSNFVVSLKSSDPEAVIVTNEEFSRLFPEIPIHLGVTEAGLLPMGEIKTRFAFERLLAQGIGDTIRVSLTLPFEMKYEEVIIGRRILADIKDGRFRSAPKLKKDGINIISCPSCSRVENEAFVELAQKVRELSSQFEDQNLTVAVMGCRVNGPGETDDADLGLWCAPNHVNLKKGTELVGSFSYDEILSQVDSELSKLSHAKKN